MNEEDVALYTSIYSRVLLSHRNAWRNAFAAAWTDLEVIILRKVRQRKVAKCCHLGMESIIMVQGNLLVRSRLTSAENQLQAATGESAGRPKCGAWDSQIHEYI